MKACIFDLDGTLLDSMRLWEQIDADFLGRRGLEVPPDYAEAVRSLSVTEAAAYTIKRFNLPDSADDLLEEWREMAVYAYGNTVEMKPNAREYLLELKGRGVTLAVATSLSSSLCGPALRHHGIEGLFDVICSTDAVAHGKAKPDIFHYVAEKLGVPASECAVFEDIPEAIRSAKLAGMTVYGVYDEASKEQWELVGQLSDGVIYDFRDAPLPE